MAGLLFFWHFQTPNPNPICVHKLSLIHPALCYYAFSKAKASMSGKSIFSYNFWLFLSSIQHTFKTRFSVPVKKYTLKSALAITHCDRSQSSVQGKLWDAEFPVYYVLFAVQRSPLPVIACLSGLILHERGNVSIKRCKRVEYK